MSSDVHKTLGKGTLKRIHVNQHVIRANHRTGGSEPPITVKTYAANVRCHVARIQGPSELVYRPNQPLSCGARLWIETRAEVTVTA